MPRKPRMHLPEVPCHVVHRGNNRQAAFFTDDDYRFYLACLSDGAKRYGVSVHAYVLMTNHVHLLVTPSVSDGVSRLMQSIGRRYVQYVNKRRLRTGTLWESRHKSSLVQHERYLLTCYRYIELNPVRAGMVLQPGDYAWSSFRENGYGQASSILEPHPIYLSLGQNEVMRQAAYRNLFRQELHRADIHAIRGASQFSMPLGGDDFRAMIECALGRGIGYASRGRPGGLRSK